jgi:hypothetical protein
VIAAGPDLFQLCTESDIMTAILVPSVALRPLFQVQGYNVASIPADANLHTLSSQHRDAMHQVRHPDEARSYRAAGAELRFADLQMHPLRLRREFLEGYVGRSSSGRISPCVDRPRLATANLSASLA